MGRRGAKADYKVRLWIFQHRAVSVLRKYIGFEIVSYIHLDNQLHCVCLVAVPTCHPSSPHGAALSAMSKTRSFNQPLCVPLLGLPSRGSTRVLHCLVSCTKENCLQSGLASHLAPQSFTLLTSTASSSLRLSQSALPVIIWGITYSLNTSPCLNVSELCSSPLVSSRAALQLFSALHLHSRGRLSTAVRRPTDFRSCPRTCDGTRW